LRAFCHDNLSRCNARRMVSRQQQRPNCACTKPASRRSVQRGFTSAPGTGGLAAWHWPARTCSPSAAAISGQKGGAATGALIRQRLGAVFIVGVQPLHHGLRPSSRAFGNRGGTTAFGNLVQRQEAFAAARMGGTQGQMAQIRNRLAPALMVNS